MPNEDTYYADGFEDCIIGVLTEGEVPRVVYDKWGMVTVLQEEGMTWEDAVEFLEFNVWGAYIEPPCTCAPLRGRLNRRSTKSTNS